MTQPPTHLPKIGPGNHKPGGATRLKYEAEVRQFRQWMQWHIDKIGFAPGSRSWAYLIEQARIVKKGEFDKAEGWLADRRKEIGSDGVPLIPLDFVAKDETRKMTGNDLFDMEETPREYINRLIRGLTESARHYWPASFWKFQKHFPILWVEKVDLIKLFEPAIPRAVKRFSGKGWSDIHSRADCLHQIAWARSQGLHGLIPVILYCGDHDPKGLEISNTIRKNLGEIANVIIADKEHEHKVAFGCSTSTDFIRFCYDVSTLEIVRFGLNEDFIEEHGLPWINNLETSSGRDLAHPMHPDHNKPYVQDYLERFGARKCEANALITNKDAALDLIEEVLDEYIDQDGIDQWEAENKRASEEATAATEHLIKMLTFIDSQGWLYSGAKLAAAAEEHRQSQQGQLPPAFDI